MIRLRNPFTSGPWWQTTRIRQKQTAELSKYCPKRRKG